MDDWWAIDEEILTSLAGNPGLTAAELGQKLGISEAAAASVLALLAAEGRVRIRVVEPTSPARTASRSPRRPPAA